MFCTNDIIRCTLSLINVQAKIRTNQMQEAGRIVTMLLDFICLWKFVIAVFRAKVAFQLLCCLKQSCNELLFKFWSHEVTFVVYTGEMTATGFPAPLATKIYYSQRSHQLRSIISNLFNASTNENCSELHIPKGQQENAILSRTSSCRKLSHEQQDPQNEKVCCSVLSADFNLLFHLGILILVLIFTMWYSKWVCEIVQNLASQVNDTISLQPYIRIFD